MGGDGEGRRRAPAPRLPRPRRGGAGRPRGVGSSRCGPRRPLGRGSRDEDQREPRWPLAARRTARPGSSRRERRDARQRHAAHGGPDLLRPGPAPALQEAGEQRGQRGGGRRAEGRGRVGFASRLTNSARAFRCPPLSLGGCPGPGLLCLCPS